MVEGSALLVVNSQWQKEDPKEDQWMNMRWLWWARQQQDRGCSGQEPMMAGCYVSALRKATRE